MRRGLRSLFFLCVFIFLFYSSVNAEVISSLWRTEKSQHFIVYYQDTPAGYVPELIDKAEKYYSDIVDNLGYVRFDFWSWDNRAKIYLFRDSAEYLRETGRAAWSGAEVDVRDRTIRTFLGQEAFFDSILPHEMTHIIFREFVGKKTVLPLWIDEGVACSQEEKSLAERLKTIKNLINQGVYLKLDNLSTIKDSSLIVPHVFYSESASLIVFLIERYGKEKFLEFSRGLRDGKKWQDALSYVYQFRDLKEMEEEWIEFIGLRN